MTRQGATGSDQTGRPISALSASVVIVSRGRPDALRLCLTGVAQLMHRKFEVIVVACPGGISAAQSLPFSTHLKLVPFDAANIARARNLGIQQAAGEVVAFIDDDAVPEATWLDHLTAPFADPEVAAAGGWVRGRNGISYQWQCRNVDATGATQPLNLPDMRARVLRPGQGRAIKTEGTNMAVRREVLADLGGFDPAYHFYLDETDLNMRLALAGLATALVPMAQVHHGYAASDRRTGTRVPRDLGQIGASMAVYLSRHCPEEQRATVWDAFGKEQRARLVHHLIRGALEPRDLRRLMRGLDQGYAAGLLRNAAPLARLPRAAIGFRPFQGRPNARSQVFAGRPWEAAALHVQAQAAAQAGHIATIYRFSPTALYHRVRFDPAGFWVQSGGLFGRSDRDQPRLRLCRFATRVARETTRTAQIRGD